MAQTIGCIELLDGQNASFSDLVECRSPGSRHDTPVPTGMHIIADLNALKVDLQLLFDDLSDGSPA